MTLRLNGDSSGFTEIKAADAAGDNSIKLPASNGGANQLLKNGSTAGELEYATGVSADTSGNVNATAIRSGGVSNTLDSAPLTSHLTTNRNGLTIQRLDGISEGQTTGIMFRQEYTTGSSNGRRMAFFGIERATSTSGDQRANFVMELCPDNSTNVGASSPNSATRLFRFTSSGRLQFLRSGGGIDFSAIQTNSAGMSSETLDSYEEGTWTPSIGGNTTYTQQQGTYIRVGRLVMINYYLTINNHGTGSSRVISGLPFTAAATTGGGAVAYFANLQQNISYLSGYIYDGSNISFYGNATPDNNLSSSVSVFRSGSVVQGSNVYMIA